MWDVVNHKIRKCVFVCRGEQRSPVMERMRIKKGVTILAYLVSARSNRGNVKENNQDACTVKTASTALGEVAFGLICDGMGGLSEGETTSATVISAFSDWFYNALPFQLGADNFSGQLFSSWNNIIDICNKKLHTYGESRGIKLGTTCCGVLVAQGRYYVINIGDSRLYAVTNKSLSQLTEDQTFVAREVREGRMTPEQAEQDPRKSVLLQCIGASNSVTPQFIEGAVTQDTAFLLCSDGFRHLVSDKELLRSYAPKVLKDKETADRNSDELIRLNMERGESDNITAAVIKVTI